jgi:hypothetical protein
MRREGRSRSIKSNGTIHEQYNSVREAQCILGRVIREYDRRLLARRPQTLEERLAPSGIETSEGLIQ